MIDVLYEDNHILVVNKPQNVPTQADESGDEDLLTMCKAYIKQKYNKQGNVFLGLVHRLDRPTGGVIVFARTTKAASRLSAQIRENNFNKHYVAVVEGILKDKIGHLTNYLKKDTKNNKVYVCPELESDAKKAELDYTVLDEHDNLSLIDISLLTGRSHQIRVQFSTLGNPIVSDIKYGAKQKITKNLSLWAYKLSFKHPTKDEVLTFTSFPPEKEIPWKYFDLHKLN